MPVACKMRLTEMEERYDIRPNPEGGWDVVDTRNGYGTIETYETREMALREAIRKDKR